MPEHTTPADPYLALDMDAFERNMAHMHRTIVEQGGKRWRPHVKAIRAPALAQRLQAAGARGVTCATLAEAETMVAAGITDVLIASQVVIAQQVQRLAELNRAARVIASADADVQVEMLAAAARNAGTVIPVVVEVDVGMHRCGVPPGMAAALLGRRMQAHAAVAFCGLMAWEGHTTMVSGPAAKERAVQHALEQLVATARECEDAGLNVEIVSCGGTGTYPISSRVPGVTEIQAGGGVFGDLRYRTEYHIPVELALTLHATVLSRPTPRRIVCNAGWRYLSAYPTMCRPVHLSHVVQLAPSAEHLTLECSQDVEDYAVGSSIELAVGYADSTVFLHRTIRGQRNGRLEEIFALPA